MHDLLLSLFLIDFVIKYVIEKKFYNFAKQISEYKNIFFEIETFVMHDISYATRSNIT